MSQKRYRYTAKEKDDETGLAYHGARYYAPWLARWERPDPSGLSDGVNRYAHVRGNPVGQVDMAGNSSGPPPILFLVRGDAGPEPDPRVDTIDAATVFLGGAGSELGTASYARPMAAELERAGLPGPVAYVPISRGLAHASNVPTTLYYRGSPGGPGVEPGSGISALLETVNEADVPGESTLNYVGYSYGSIVAAQAALGRLEGGEDVGFVALIASPMAPDSELKRALVDDPRIGKVITVNIPGDYFSGGVDLRGVFDPSRHFEFAVPDSTGAFPSAAQVELADVLSDIVSSPTPREVTISLPTPGLTEQEFSEVQPFLECDDVDVDFFIPRVDRVGAPQFAP